MKSYYFSKSSELQDYLDSAENGTVYLDTGDYYVKPSTRFSFKIIGHNELGSRIHVESPLLAKYVSKLRDVNVMPTGDFAALDLFACSYSQFDNVFFDSPVQYLRGGFKEDYSNIERSGVGVTTTEENNGDDTYNVQFNHCKFASFRIGVDLVKPKIKGTTRMLFNDCTWDACGVNFNGNRVNDCKIYSGLMQLAYVSLMIDGNNNRVRDLHFERNQMNWIVTEGSHYNVMDTDSDARLAIDRGYGTDAIFRKRRNLEKKDLD